jgi:hypothetical protein
VYPRGPRVFWQFGPSGTLPRVILLRFGFTLGTAARDSDFAFCTRPAVVPAREFRFWEIASRGQPSGSTHCRARASTGAHTRFHDSTGSSSCTPIHRVQPPCRARVASLHCHGIARSSHSPSSSCGIDWCERPLFAKIEFTAKTL